MLFRLTLLILLFLPLTCFAEKTIRWKQEVQLSDGRIIIMKRVSVRSGWVFPENHGMELSQVITFTNPDTNEKITWSLPEGLHPYALDFENKIPYLVLDTYTMGDYNNWNCPNPPYFIYRYENKIWQPISFEQLPSKFSKRNLMDMSKSFLKVSDDKFITVAEQDKWLLRLADYLRSINRKKIHPIAKGCFESVLFKNGRESEINIPYIKGGILITPKED